MARNLLVLSLSLFVTLLGAEAILRTVFPVPPTWREPQTRHLKSPLLGWILPPASKSFTIDAPVTVNSLGLRDDEVPPEKPAGETRILCLGDSFTFALGVRFEDLYVQQLERELRDRHSDRQFQVINAGVAGYNTRQELILYLTLGQALEPDLLVVGFYWNDLVGNDEELPDVSATPAMATKNGAVHEPARRHLIPAPLRNALRSSVLLYQSVTRAQTIAALISPPMDVYSRVQRALLSGDASALHPYWRDTETRLLQLAEAAKRAGIPVILLVFPSENEVRQDFPKLVFSERLREIWEPTGFPIIDLTAPYRESLKAGANPFLAYDLHPNALGMKIAADALYREIRVQGYLGLAGESVGSGRR